MRAIIDEETCTGCGACTDICPEVFEMDALAEKAVVALAVVPTNVEPEARSAAESCPVEAITIEG